MNKVRNYNERLCSLDIFRGFTIAGMMIVNNPGSWGNVFSQLQHTSWHGCTFADLVFPFFIWIIGVAMVFSFAKYDSRGELIKKVIIRTIVLFSIGLFLNGFPFGFIEGSSFSWLTIRIPGVLQRIAVCYFVSAMIVIYSSIVWQIIWSVLFITGYWLAIKFISVPGFGVGVLEPMGNLVWYIDANLLSGHTLSKAPAPGFDPEGILSSLPAISTMLFGVLIGHFLKFKKSKETKTVLMLIFGIAFALVGFFMSYWMPINKNLWTPSYAVFTSGLALIIFTGFYWLTDVRGYKKLFNPLRIFGLNAILLYVISILIIRLTMFAKITKADGSLISLKGYYYDSIFLFTDYPQLSSFLHAVVLMLFIYLIAYILYRMKVILKV